MTHQRNGNLTRLSIIRTATQLFLENGYSATSPRMICDDMGISLGSLTYYFPTKEHLLAVLIEMLAEFQWKTVRDITKEGESAITAICFELTAMAAMCENSEVARDLYISAYTNPMSLEIIRKSDLERSKTVYRDYCRNWSHEEFAEAENIVCGIEYTTLMVTESSPPLHARIACAMNTILGIYGIPKERKNLKIEKALSLDYREFGQQLLDEFKRYVYEITEKSLIDLALNKDRSDIEKA